MRNTILAQEGGAIVSRPKPAEAQPASQLAAAGKPSLPEPYVNWAKAIADAHIARGREMARLLRQFFRWLAEGARQALRSDTERYLAQATDLADLERRLRSLERGEHPNLC